MRTSTNRRGISGWKKALRYLFRLTLLAGLLILAMYAETYFTITEIRVTGDSNVPAAEIIKASGAADARNIFFLREKKAVELIKKQYPQLETVAIKRDLPGTVTIKIDERTPVATIMTADGYWLIDKNTVCFDFTADKNPGYPLITGLDGGIIAPGMPLNCPARAKVLQEFFKAWGGADFAELDSLDLSSNYNLIVHTDQQMEVWLGDSSNMSQKLLLVERSLPFLPETGKIKLDVRSGSRLIVAGNVMIKEKGVEP